MSYNVQIEKKAAKVVKAALFLFLTICFAACTEKESVISGNLPDATYDGEMVYLVPIKDASSKTVDSTLIKDSHFQFKVKPEKQNKIFIIRVRPILRVKLQEILVASEPGTISVNLDAPSSSSGTPLNQTLQQWKEKKYVFDSTYYAIRRQYNKESDESEKARLQSEADETMKEYRTYADSLAERNKNNAVGQFILSLNEHP